MVPSRNRHLGRRPRCRLSGQRRFSRHSYISRHRCRLSRHYEMKRNSVLL